MEAQSEVDGSGGNERRSRVAERKGRRSRRRNSGEKKKKKKNDDDERETKREELKKKKRRRRGRDRTAPPREATREQEKASDAGEQKCEQVSLGCGSTSVRKRRFETNQMNRRPKRGRTREKSYTNKSNGR